jgi:hypothetical protein
MDTASIAGAMAGARMSQMQSSLAAEMLRMNAQSAASIVQVLNDAQQNLKSLANVADGVGRNVNIVA